MLELTCFTSEDTIQTPVVGRCLWQNRLETDTTGSSSDMPKQTLAYTLSMQKTSAGLG